MQTNIYPETTLRIIKFRRPLVSNNQTEPHHWTWYETLHIWNNLPLHISRLALGRDVRYICRKPLAYWGLFIQTIFNTNREKIRQEACDVTTMRFFKFSNNPLQRYRTTADPEPLHLKRRATRQKKTFISYRSMKLHLAWISHTRLDYAFEIYCLARIIEA